MARQIGEVIERMCAALEGGAVPGDLVPQLRRLAQTCAFSAPEMMGSRWAQLVLIFNEAVFGTTDEREWDRAKAPKWSVDAGRILAGEA